MGFAICFRQGLLLRFSLVLQLLGLSEGMKRPASRDVAERGGGAFAYPIPPYNRIKNPLTC